MSSCNLFHLLCNLIIYEYYCNQLNNFEIVLNCAKVGNILRTHKRTHVKLELFFGFFNHKTNFYFFIWCRTPQAIYANVPYNLFATYMIFFLRQMKSTAVLFF